MDTTFLAGINQLNLNFNNGSLSQNTPHSFLASPITTPETGRPPIFHLSFMLLRATGARQCRLQMQDVEGDPGSRLDEVWLLD
jgi:hypothetical protein